MALNLTFTLETQEPLKHFEICDASAAIAIDKDHFIVGNDEDNFLRVYKARESDKPIQTLFVGNYCLNNLRPDKKEVDIEGVAQIDDVTYWITSHGRNSDGEKKIERHNLFANKLRSFQRDDQLIVTEQQVGHTYENLVFNDLINNKKLSKYNFAEAEQKAAQAEGGINIEGLCATPKGELLIGFRNPIFDGKALLLPLKHPAKLVKKEDESAKFGDPIELDLGGRGIRSIEYWKKYNIYVICAGSFGDSSKFALYLWSGNSDKQPKLVEGFEFPKDFRPEALLFYPDRDDRIHILSDDGDAKREGDTPCKKIKDENNPNKYFQSIWLTVSRG